MATKDDPEHSVVSFIVFFTEVLAGLLQTARNIQYDGRLLATGIYNTYLSLIT